MTVEMWKEELFELYQKCRQNPLWPKNFMEAIEWQDVDAQEYLKELLELDRSGALKP